MRYVLTLLLLALPSILSGQVVEAEPPTYCFKYKGYDREAETNWSNAPIYPIEAQVAGIEGEVETIFTIYRNGKVRDIEIIKSMPKGVFDQAAISYLKSQKFKFAVKNCESIDTPNIARKISFEIEDST